MYLTVISLPANKINSFQYILEDYDLPRGRNRPMYKRFKYEPNLGKIYEKVDCSTANDRNGKGGAKYVFFILHFADTRIYC